MNKHYAWMTLCCLFLYSIPTELLAWGTTAGWTTHKIIAHDAITNVDAAAEFPDVTRFHDNIRDGAGFEAHNLPDDNSTEWWGNGVGPEPKKWFSAGLEADGKEGALSLYKKYMFSEAYTRIGYELHCAQDEFVPAHKKFCRHGQILSVSIYVDDLEWHAKDNHGYSMVELPWNHIFVDHDGTHVFNYWLNDSEDDDDGDEDGADADDEGPSSSPYKDINIPWPVAINAFGVADDKWGTYGQPDYNFLPWDGFNYLHELVPGRDFGLDEFGLYLQWSVGIIHRQLQKSLDASVSGLKSDSKELPPLVPDDDTHGKPSISLKIFGPNKPVDVSFVAMENRQKKVLVSILAGATAIKDTTGKVWDGGSTATIDLASDSTASSLPWKDTISCSWNGDHKTGQFADGNYTITMKVKDADDNDSEGRTRSVKFDKTKPIGTITVSVCP